MKHQVMHPNDSESFTGGIGGPSDPALVDGDNVERDAMTIPIALGALALTCGALFGVTWLVETLRAWAVTP